MTTAVSEKTTSLVHPFRLVGTDTICELLTCTSYTLYKMIHAGTIPCVKIGHEYKFDYDEIVEWYGELKKRQTQERLKGRTEEE